MGPLVAICDTLVAFPHRRGNAARVGGCDAVQAQQEIVNDVLRTPHYGARARRLREHHDGFAPSHVDGFLARGHEVLRSDPAQARQCARLGLYVARRLDEAAPTVACLRVLTQAALLIGRFPEALRAVDEALDLLRPSGSMRERSELRTMRVQVLTQLERWPEAREVGLRVLEDFEAVGDVRGIIRIRLALADLATNLERPREALRHFRQVEWLLPEQAPARLRATIAANRANALQACNRFQAAERWFRQARAIFVAEGCAHTTAQMDYNLAYAAVLRGRFGEALRAYDAVDAEFERLRDDMHRAHIDLDRAEVHLLLNLPDDARGFADRAAERFEELGLTRDRAQADYFGARAATLTGELQAAADRYAAARKGFSSLGMRSREIACRVQQGYVWHRMERPGKAGGYLRKAEGLLDEFANPLTVASVRLLRANLAHEAGRHEAALEDAMYVLARTRRIFAPWLEVEAQRVCAAAYVGLERPDAAIGALCSAIEIVERHRGGVPPDEYVTAWFEARAGLYVQLVELLIARGDLAEAFHYALRAKARALIDTMADGHETEADEIVGIHETRIRVLRESLNAVYWELLRAGGGLDIESADARAAAHERAAALEQELDTLLRQRAIGRDGAPAALPSTAEIQQGLAADTAVVELLQTPDALIAFVVTRDGVHATRTAVDAGEVAERVQRLRFHIAKHERPRMDSADLVMRATVDNLLHLRRWVLDPVAPHLEAARLVIAPHGRLHSIPFHALPWGDGWLCDRFEVLYVPSAAVHAQCARRTPAATGAPAVFGVPDASAPRIEDEARAVATLLDTNRLYLGEQATIESMRKAAEDAPILHVATHGMFRRSSPDLSSLQLADGWLSRHDLDEVDVRGGLVVLSMCESGVAGVTAGGEVLGLARGFLRAGAPALLCSQWRVRDDVTALFMDAFYRALRAGRDAAAAHREAMAHVRARHAHPYYWAPFFLMGAPTRTARARSATMEGNDR